MNRSRASARGDQTREALLEAATDIFGCEGFHAASTRAIAQAAGSNQALIGYHFGGKEGLYLAVFEFIVQQMTAGVLPVAQSMEDELHALETGAPRARERALQQLETAIGSFIKQLALPAGAFWPRLILREQQDPTAAFDILYTGLYEPLLDLVTRLVGVLIDADPASEAARARALMIMGQVVVFLAARTMVLRHMGWSELGSRELEVVREQLIESLHQQFDPEV